MKINAFKSFNKYRVGSKSKSKNRSTFVSKRRTHEGDTCTKGAMGIGKNCLTDVVDKVTDLIGSKVPAIKEYEGYITPALDQIKSLITSNFNFCVGDLTGAELQEESDMVCDVIPYDDETKMGTVAFKVGGIPCGGQPTDISVCFTFDKCGSFGLAFDGGIPTCIATATGAGAIISPFLQAISNVGFAVNFNNNIVQSYDISTYDAAQKNFLPKTVTIRGNLYFTMTINLSEIIFGDKMKIGKKKLSELFSITGSMNVIADFGTLFSEFKTYLDGARNGSSDGKSFFKYVMSSKAEFGLNIYAEVAFSLSELTSGFLPDLSLGSTDFNLVATTGNGNTELKAGIYTQLTFKMGLLNDFYSWFQTKFKDIFSFFGIELPELDLNVSINFALTITKELVGVSFGGALGALSGSLTCLYEIKTGKLSCGGGEVSLFTVIQDIANGVKWVVYKAKEFFEQTGEAIKGFFNDVGTFVSDLFTGEGVPIHTCGSDREQSGLLCYEKCRPGYYGSINYCRMSCPDGFSDHGLFCYKPGPIWTLSACKANYHGFGCCICSPDCPRGMTDIGISCHKGEDYQRDWGIPLGCASDETFRNGLCYKKNRNKLRKERKSSEMMISSKKSAENYKKVIKSKVKVQKDKACKEYGSEALCKTHRSCIWKKSGNKAEKCLLDLRSVTQMPTKNGFLMDIISKLIKRIQKIAQDTLNQNKNKLKN